MSELGIFPQPSRPRVIWLGVEAPPQLAQLQRAVEERMQGLSFPAGKKRFLPHLTLGRVTRGTTNAQNRKIAQTLFDSRIEFRESLTVKEIALVKSELRPGGAHYSRLFAAKMAAEEVEV